MPKTYTEHKLTNAQCKRLSQLYNRRPHLHGVALYALVGKGLVGSYEVPNDDETGHWLDSYYITPAGREAFEKARREGW